MVLVELLVDPALCVEVRVYIVEVRRIPESLPV